MKKVLVTSVVAAAGLALAGFSTAATVGNHVMGKTWYVGAGVNENASRNQDLSYPVVRNISTIPVLHYVQDSTQLGWNVFLGKKLTRHFAVESGFNYLGDETYRGKRDFIHYPELKYHVKPGKLQGRNMYNVYLDGLYSYPIWKDGMHKISVYAKGGAIYMHARMTTAELVNTGANDSDWTPVKYSATVDSFGLNYGVGLSYNYKEYGARVSYNAYAFRNLTIDTKLIPNTINAEVFWMFA